jgi:hypothetical protein
MKTLKLVLLSAVSLSVMCQSDKKTEMAVRGAIKGVLTDHFAIYEPKVDLFFNGPNSEDLAVKILRGMPVEISVRVFRLDNLASIEMTSPSVFLFDSSMTYLKFLQKKIFMSKDRTLPNHLVYVPQKGGTDLIARLSEEKIAIENQSLLNIVNDTTADLVTSYKYAPGLCNSAHYKTINRFATNRMTWQNESFFPEKYQSFYGCPLTVAHQSDALPSRESQMIFKVLAQQLKFQYISVQVTASEKQFEVFEFISMHSIVLSIFFDFSTPLFSDHLTFTVPAGEPYTQLEKMFLMFDKETWICIGITLCFALIAIQVISCMSTKVHNFVFGRDIRTPTLNVADIFLNGGQNRIPTRNFARFMLMLFVIWSLIIRTCYQSILYENLQVDMRKPQIKTIDELNDQKFSLCYINSSNVFFDDFALKRQVILVM